MAEWCRMGRALGTSAVQAEDIPEREDARRALPSQNDSQTNTTDFLKQSDPI